MEKNRLVPLTLLILIIILAAYYIINNISSFKNLKIINPYNVVFLIFLFLLLYFVIGLTTKAILTPLGVNLSRREAFQLSITTGFYNLITPFKGGLASRATYLKRKYDFPYTIFLSTVAATYVLEFFVASSAGIISTYVIFLKTGFFSLFLFLVFLFMFLLTLFIILFSPKIGEKHNKWLNRFIRVINGWHILKKSKKLIAKISFLIFLKLLIASIALFLQFNVFGISITYLKTIFLTSIGNLGIIISITPSGIGINEAITVFSALTIGITPTESITASILGRLIQTIILFILGPIFSYILLKKQKEK